MSMNESNIFEENDLFIEGRTLKTTFCKIKSEFNQIFSETFSNVEYNPELIQDLKYFKNNKEQMTCI